MDERMTSDYKELTYAVESLYDAMTESRGLELGYTMVHLDGVEAVVNISITISHGQAVVWVFCERKYHDVRVEVYGPMGGGYSRQRGETDGPRLNVEVCHHAIVCIYATFYRKPSPVPWGWS